MNAPAATDRKPLPDIADLIFVFIVGLLVFMLPSYMLNDGSTGWHLATGHYILQHGQIPHTDLFSSTYPDRPWVPYEWLVDLFAAILDKIGGLKLVAVAASLAVAWLIPLLYLQCRRSGAHFAIALALCMFGVFASTVHWLARPHIFTFYGVYLFSQLLERYRTGVISGRKLLIGLGLTMVVWTNAHPGFLIGIAIAVIYLVCEAMIAFSSSGDFQRDSISRLKVFAAALGTAIGATLINPNLFHLHVYISEYLHRSVVLQNTNEFMPPDFKQLHAICMALIFFMFVVGLVLRRTQIGLAPLMMVLAFAWLGINSMRNEPLFVIVAVPITAALYSNMSLENVFGLGFTPAAWLVNGQNRIKLFSANIDEVEATCTMHILPIALSVLLVGSCLLGGKIGPVELVTCDWDPKNKPTETLKCIKDHNLDWRHGFNLDNWGGYIYYKTGNRVWIDDRLDFYGEKVFVDYGRVVKQMPGWESLLERDKIEWILFPKLSTFTQSLLTNPDWKLLCEDPAAVVLVRASKPESHQPQQLPQAQ